MVPVAVSGNISREATTPSGNIFAEATRGVDRHVDFELACSDVVIALGPSSVPPSPFENFVE
jgi:hypothetical protein